MSKKKVKHKLNLSAGPSESSIIIIQGLCATITDNLESEREKSPIQLARFFKEVIAYDVVWLESTEMKKAVRASLQDATSAKRQGIIKLETEKLSDQERDILSKLVGELIEIETSLKNYIE